MDARQPTRRLPRGWSRRVVRSTTLRLVAAHVAFSIAEFAAWFAILLQTVSPRSQVSTMVGVVESATLFGAAIGTLSVAGLIAVAGPGPTLLPMAADGPIDQSGSHPPDGSPKEGALPDERSRTRDHSDRTATRSEDMWHHATRHHGARRQAMP